MEGGVLCLCGWDGVQIGSDMWPSHRGSCRWIRRAHQLLPGKLWSSKKILQLTKNGIELYGFKMLCIGPWLLRGADHHAGGGAGVGARSHGHVHRAGHPLLEVQTTEDEGTPGALLVQSQHPKVHSTTKDDCYLRCWFVTLLFFWSVLSSVLLNSRSSSPPSSYNLIQHVIWYSPKGWSKYRHLHCTDVTKSVSFTSWLLFFFFFRSWGPQSRLTCGQSLFSSMTSMKNSTMPSSPWWAIPQMPGKRDSSRTSSPRWSSTAFPV